MLFCGVLCQGKGERYSILETDYGGREQTTKMRVCFEQEKMIKRNYIVIFLIIWAVQMAAAFC